MSQRTESLRRADEARKDRKERRQAWVREELAANPGADALELYDALPEELSADIEPESWYDSYVRPARKDLGITERPPSPVEPPAGTPGPRHTLILAHHDLVHEVAERIRRFRGGDRQYKSSSSRPWGPSQPIWDTEGLTDDERAMLMSAAGDLSYHLEGKEPPIIKKREDRPLTERMGADHEIRESRKRYDEKRKAQAREG